MKPAPFDYVAPTTVAEALALLREHGDEAQPLAGGQSLVPMLALRVARPAVLIDLNRVPELSGIARDDGGLRIGAMTRQATILNDPLVATAFPALARATAFIGHHQTRNRGTLGGSIALADPNAEYPAFALANEAALTLRSAGGERVVPATGFFEGPYMTARAADELLVDVRFAFGPGTRIIVDEIAQRRGDFALSGLVARIDLDGERIMSAGLAWFGMGPQPLRAPTAEAMLAGASPAAVDVDAVAAAAVADTSPTDDTHASADYRVTAGRALAARALRKLISGEGS